jgi:hypothetical protein
MRLSFFGSSRISETRLTQGARLLTISILLLVASSCVDLTQIAQFAKASQEVGNNFKGILDNTVAECQAADRFSPAGSKPLNCDLLTQLEPAIAKVNGSLFGYIASLGQLGSGAAPKSAFSSVAKELKDADTKITQTQQDDATAAGGLADAISKVVLSGYRQHVLEKLIHDSNSNVQQVTDFLSTYAAGKLEEVLNNGWTLEEEYCNSNRNQLGGAEPLAGKLLKLKCDEDKARIDTRVAAVEQYKTALAIVAKTHETLDKDRHQWSAKQLLTDIGPEISNMNASALALRKGLR